MASKVTPECMIIQKGSVGELARRKRAVFEGYGWIYEHKARDPRAKCNFSTSEGNAGLRRAQLKENPRKQIVSKKASAAATRRPKSKRFLERANMLKVGDPATFKRSNRRLR